MKATKENIKKYNKKAGIYALIHQDEIIYIGSSKDIGSRLRHHLSENALNNTLRMIYAEEGRSNRCKALAMYHFISTHREEIQFNVLEETNDLNEREEYYINQHKPKYNYAGVDIPFRKRNDLNDKLDKLLELDKMLLKAEAAAGLMDGFPITSALVDKENETLILE